MMYVYFDKDQQYRVLYIIQLSNSVVVLVRMQIYSDTLLTPVLLSCIADTLHQLVNNV